jgi:CRISPR-associated protein Cas5d
MTPNDQILEVWGEFACFSRPEMKVERFSYPVITPSAARGIFDAVYCKPNKDPAKAEFRWQITKIEVLSPPKYIALRRNEVKDKAPSERTIMQWANGSKEPQPILADGTKDLLGTDMKGRTQRQTMALKDVRYRIHAHIRPWKGFEGRLKAMESQFRRRASKGKCVYQPYFGCREFPAYFELVDGDSPQADPCPLDLDIGIMLYDVFDLSKPGSCYDSAFICVFRAQVKDGVLDVPGFETEDVLKPGKEV